MKRLIPIIISLFIFQVFYAQKYIMFDEISDEYEVKSYKLNTLEMYEVDKEIEMYNIIKPILSYNGGENILLISILPDMKTEMNWKEIPISEVENSTIPIKEVFQQIEENKDNKFFNHFYLVKKDNDKYYTSKNTLCEYFKIVNYPPEIYISGRNIVNLGQRPITYQDFRKAYKESFNYHNPMEVISYSVGMNFIIHNGIFQHIYLSSIEEKEGKNIYHFWTFDDWHICKGYNWHRGIDRFVYIPEMGIVGGSYDFYFDRFLDYCEGRSHSNRTEFKRTVGRKIMWAKEIFNR